MEYIPPHFSPNFHSQNALRSRYKSLTNQTQPAAIGKRWCLTLVALGLLTQCIVDHANSYLAFTSQIIELKMFMSFFAVDKIFWDKQIYIRSAVYFSHVIVVIQYSLLLSFPFFLKQNQSGNRDTARPNLTQLLFFLPFFRFSSIFVRSFFSLFCRVLALLVQKHLMENDTKTCTRTLYRFYTMSLLFSIICSDHEQFIVLFSNSFSPWTFGRGGVLFQAFYSNGLMQHLLFKPFLTLAKASTSFFFVFR